MSALRLELPWPPSVNRYWRAVNGRVLISREGRAYRERVADIVRAARTVGFGKARLGVDVTLQPPDMRRRDIDNVLKSLLDALEHAGLFDDDGQIDRLSVTRMPPARPEGRAVVKLGALT